MRCTGRNAREVGTCCANVTLRALRVPFAGSGTVLRVREETPVARVCARSVARAAVYLEKECGLAVVRHECERGG